MTTPENSNIIEWLHSTADSIAAGMRDWQASEFEIAKKVRGYREAAAQLATIRSSTIKECAEACRNEYVDAERTKEISDVAYNQACDDCANACLALDQPANDGGKEGDVK